MVSKDHEWKKHILLFGYPCFSAKAKKRSVPESLSISLGINGSPFSFDAQLEVKLSVPDLNAIGAKIPQELKDMKNDGKKLQSIFLFKVNVNCGD